MYSWRANTFKLNASFASPINKIIIHKKKKRKKQFKLNAVANCQVIENLRIL
jgi:hypothetical protein